MSRRIEIVDEETRRERFVKAGKKQAARGRAMQRAFARLRDKHRVEFNKIYAEEVEKAFHEEGLSLKK